MVLTSKKDRPMGESENFSYSRQSFFLKAFTTDIPNLTQIVIDIEPTSTIILYTILVVPITKWGNGLILKTPTNTENNFLRYLYNNNSHF